jgi:hypothetical protein
MPLAPTQGELTSKQRAFIELAYVEYKTDERMFMAQVMGAEVENRQDTIIKPKEQMSAVLPEDVKDRIKIRR